MKIMLICTTGETVINFRKDLIQELTGNGNSVTVISTDDKRKEEILNLGIQHYICPMRNTSINIFQNFVYKRKLKALIKQDNPDKVFTFMIKPNIWGSRAAKKCGVKDIYCMIEGMGRIYTNQTFKNRILRFIINRLYRGMCKNATKIFFLNNDDANFFRDRKLIQSEKSVVINGIGIDTAYYQPIPLPGADMFLMVARLLYEKGVIEFCEAAENLKVKYPQVRFCILGSEDTIMVEDLQKYRSVDYLGTVTDVRPFYNECTCYVLPSYREGMPRTTLEALATGRPVITTDAFGCRDTVIDGLNGFLVPIKNSAALIEKMELLINNESLKTQMALESRKLAEEKFSSKIINNQIMAEMAIGRSLESFKEEGIISS